MQVAVYSALFIVVYSLLPLSDPSSAKGKSFFRPFLTDKQTIYLIHEDHTLKSYHDSKIRNHLNVYQMDSLWAFHSFIFLDIWTNLTHEKADESCASPSKELKRKSRSLSFNPEGAQQLLIQVSNKQKTPVVRQ